MSDTFKVSDTSADAGNVAVGSYRHPTLRNAAVRLISWQLRLRIARRAMQRASGWIAAGLLFVMIAATARVWVTVGAFVLAAAVGFAQWWSEQRAFELSGVAETDSLSGREFEHWVAQFLTELGFQVELTPYSGDFGADIVATWNGVRIAVQVKSGHTNMGVAAIQQVVGARFYYDCEQAMVITNQYFTDQAVLLAQATGVQLRHRTDLARKLAELKGP